MTLFAAVGDVHGHHHAMVALLSRWQERSGLGLDLVLQVGDFEPHRKKSDLDSAVAPARKRRVGDFRDFALGKARFPWPLVFIGGNHEPYGYLDELGSGEVAEGCRYLGRAGWTDQGGLTIAGLSGIFLPSRLSRPRPEPAEAFRNPKPHVAFNSADIAALRSLRRCDILLTHDWPSGIVRDGDQDSFERGRRKLRGLEVGNLPTRKLIERLRPRLALCGHMHRAYRATIPQPTETYDTRVCCLADVASGPDSLAVFDVGEEIQEITERGLPGP